MGGEGEGEGECYMAYDGKDVIKYQPRYRI